MSRSILSLDALGPDAMRDEPYAWGYVPQAIEHASAEELRRTFPTDGFWEVAKHDGEKLMRFQIRPLVPMGVARLVMGESLPPVWHQLVDELLAPAYREACERAMGCALQDAELDISIWRWGPQAHLDPHPDLPRKIASQVFYFNEAWDTSWGGSLNILNSPDPEDIVAELPPTLGSASLLVRSDTSWHAVAPVTAEAPAERLNVIATWQYPGTESPYFSLEADGTVRCHTRGNKRVS